MVNMVSQLNSIEPDSVLAKPHRIVARVRVPGSSANVGAGFDTCALALGVYADMTFLLLDEPDESPMVSIACDTVDGWAQSGRFFELILKDRLKNDALLRRLRLVLRSDIPVGRGLGSSAAVIAGALFALRRMQGLDSDKQFLLDEGTVIEGHPDNIGASVLGGFVVAAKSARNSKIYAQKINWPDDWCPILVIPDRPLETSKARAVLPGVIPKADAIFNLQHSSLLVAAVQNQDEELLSESLDDRMHEPYRSALLPELPSLKRALRESAAFGVVLSGAGSSMLVLCHERDKEKTLSEVHQWASDLPLAGKVRALQVASEGMQELHG